MNIKILDSWLKDYLDTDASAYDIAKYMSLSSISIERVEKWKNDYLYDIEVTTNRVDLMSVKQLALEASAILPRFGLKAKFKNHKIDTKKHSENKYKISIKNDPSLVSRICAVVMDVKIDKSSDEITDRLESSGIRSLNNVIDITNYVMRVIGHPTHVFDFERLNTQTLVIRESKKGEEIQTLDKKTYVLSGGDIVASDEKGNIVDLLGVMGLNNSVVTEKTKRILFFVDTCSKNKIRKTSMSHGIRTEAAQINEKGIDPNLAIDALFYGIELFEKHASGKIVSDIIDIYPDKLEPIDITVSKEKINSTIGIDIPIEESEGYLRLLGFDVSTEDNNLYITAPTIRQDIKIQEDIIEEVARIYGYHNLPSILPPETKTVPAHLLYDEFYIENRIKQSLKYWGFTEVYTYSMVSENLYEGPLEGAVGLNNPLDEDHAYMRRTLVPSLLQVTRENSAKNIRIFEIANTYSKVPDSLPEEKRVFAGVVKSENTSFFEVKGVIEQVMNDLGITNYEFKPSSEGIGSDIIINKKNIGRIEELDDTTFNFEIDFMDFVSLSSFKKTYVPISKYPPIIEDLALIVPDEIATSDVLSTIKNFSGLVEKAELFDKHNNTRTFRIIYRDRTKNLTDENVREIRLGLLNQLQKKLNILPK